MTDQEIFEAWLRTKTSDDMNYMSIEGAFLAALAIGRRERTVEIAERFGPWNNGLMKDTMQTWYPGCFEKGDM